MTRAKFIRELSSLVGARATFESRFLGAPRARSSGAPGLVCPCSRSACPGYHRLVRAMRPYYLPGLGEGREIVGEGETFEATLEQVKKRIAAHTILSGPREARR